MIFTVIINLCILAAAAACLTVYITAYVTKPLRVIAHILSAASAVGLAGAAVCAIVSGNAVAVTVISSVTATGLAILLISFVIGKSERTAVLRLCLAPLWAMLTVLISYAAAAVAGSSAAVRAFGIFSALILALPPACDFYRLYFSMKKHEGIAEVRRKRAALRSAKREARKKMSKKRSELKRGKARK